VRHRASGSVAARQAAGGRRAATAADAVKHRKHGVGSSPRLAVALLFLVIDRVSVVEDLARDLPAVMLGMLSSIGGRTRAADLELDRRGALTGGYDRTP
jgi:hypothetical protein